MKMTSFQVVLLAIFAALAVAGVLIFAFAIGGTSSNSIGAMTIWGTFDQYTFSTLLREFSDRDQNFLQVTYVQKSAATYEEELTRAIASGTGPDLFLLRHDYAIRAANQVLVIPYTGESYSVSRAQFESRFVDVAAPFMVEKGVMAIPFLADPLVLYWNKDILSTYGFAQPPQYWDQLPAMVPVITKRNDAGQIVLSTIPLGEYSNIDNAKDILSLMILQVGGTITVYDDNGKLMPALSGNSPASIGAVEKALDFYTSFANPSKPGTYTWNRSLNSSRASFAGAGTALYIGHASEEALIKKMNPNLNFAVAKVPQIRAASTTINTAHVYGFAIPRNAKNPSGALTLAFFLASSDNTTTAAQYFKIPSVRRDVLSKKADGNMAIYQGEVIKGRSWVDPDPVATEKIFRTMIENTTSGSVPLLSDAVQRAQQQLNAIFGI
ncbi:carbohydrate ABC transporter substrate-binding protein [Candidatus Kaiserbacteria bacterium]|nr:carbohydrate ABC transporter substrate-binding protein [Candidatus Kaiserbacteria bacterium]